MEIDVSYAEAISKLETFLADPKCTTGYTLDKMLGAMVGFLSCSEYQSEIDLAELIVGNDAEGFNEWLEDGETRFAWVAVVNHLTEQLVTEAFVLSEHYPYIENQLEPSADFVDWCDGYLSGLLLNDFIWEGDFEFMRSFTDADELEDIETEFDSIIDLVFLISNWKKTLDMNEKPEILQKELSQIYAIVEHGVIINHGLALRLEELKLESGALAPRSTMDVEIENEPFIREMPKTGRNDPCPCRSGKKFKKCCLH